MRKLFTNCLFTTGQLVKSKLYSLAIIIIIYISRGVQKTLQTSDIRSFENRVFSSHQLILKGLTAILDFSNCHDQGCYTV